MSVEAGLIASRFLHYLAALGLLGASLYPLYSFREGLAHELRFARRVKHSLTAFAVLTLIGAMGWFAFTSAVMADNPAASIDPSVWWTVVASSDFGSLWVARAAMVVAILALLPRWPSRVSFRFIPVLAALIVASLAATGHAREPEGAQGIVHASSDAAHLVAAGIWLGGLWPLALALAQDRDAGHAGGTSTSVLLLRFSGVGMASVAVLAASGIINAWFLVGTLQALVSTLYGQLLVVKIALFLAMVAAAVANRTWIMPKLANSDALMGGTWRRSIRRNVLVEQLLGLSVLAIVSILGIVQPPSS